MVEVDLITGITYQIGHSGLGLARSPISMDRQHSSIGMFAGNLEGTGIAQLRPYFPEVSPELQWVTCRTTLRSNPTVRTKDQGNEKMVMN